MNIRLLKVVGFFLLAIWLSGCTTRRDILHAKETVLKDDLFKLRRAIDEFTDDKKKAPQSLDDLVHEGYLRQIPKDPMTNQADWNPIMESDVQSADDWTVGIADIHSSSNLMSTEGTAYSSW
jgi:general secretion pathway protein G